MFHHSNVKHADFLTYIKLKDTDSKPDEKKNSKKKKKKSHKPPFPRPTVI